VSVCLIWNQVFNSFALTGEPHYKDHVIGYLDAWLQRTADNGGVIPSNVGLDGTIGGSTQGKWWGGVYGWGFHCVNTAQKSPMYGQRVFRGMGTGCKSAAAAAAAAAAASAAMHLTHSCHIVAVVVNQMVSWCLEGLGTAFC
jgi:hypothetical protein